MRKLRTKKSPVIFLFFLVFFDRPWRNEKGRGPKRRPRRGPTRLNGWPG